MWRPERLRLQVSTLHGNGPSTLSEIGLTRQAEGARRRLLLAFLVVPEDRIWKRLCLTVS